MSMSYGWFAAPHLGEDGVLELVRTVPNAGLTERIAGVWSDVYVGGDGKVVVEPADLEPFTKELERGRSGSISYDAASSLELGKCICLEQPKDKKRVRNVRFREWRIVDLAAALAEVRAWIDEGHDDATLE